MARAARTHPAVQLHLIGQLQSNKAEDAVALFDAIHSLDRPSLVKALAKAMDKRDRRVPCFVQVDVGEEDQKGGCPVAELPALLEQARDADIPVAGLMCIPPWRSKPRPFFAFLDKLARDHGLDGRSMGMSGDYETAVRLGATHVRVGTALFGARPRPQVAQRQGRAPYAFSSRSCIASLAASISRASMRFIRSPGSSFPPVRSVM